MAKAVQPRLSVNKLGEYMVATPRRRRSIVVDQKNPQAFKVARYTEAEEAISDFLANGADDDEILAAAIERLQRVEPKSEWDGQRVQLCIEAIEQFMEIDLREELRSRRVRPGGQSQPVLPIAGVAVSVRPELLTTSERKGARCAGAIKLVFSKTVPLTDDSAGYISTTLHQYLEHNRGKAHITHCDECLVVDVFAGGVYCAPRSFKRRRQDIHAACEEIARAWTAL